MSLLLVLPMLMLSVQQLVVPHLLQQQTLLLQPLLSRALLLQLRLSTSLLLLLMTLMSTDVFGSTGGVE
jgi:hypothetical protein